MSSARAASLDIVPCVMLECVVCLDSLDDLKQHTETLAACGHTFHAACLREKCASVLCPYCRWPLPDLPSSADLQGAVCTHASSILQLLDKQLIEYSDHWF